MGASLGGVDHLEEQLLLGDAGPDAVALEAGEVAFRAAFVLAGTDVARCLFGVELVVARDRVAAEVVGRVELNADKRPPVVAVELLAAGNGIAHIPIALIEASRDANG